MFTAKNLSALSVVRRIALSLVAIALLSLPATAQLFSVNWLVSDIPDVGSQPTDPDLVNPWGMAHSAGSPWWVSDNATGKLTLYDGTGVKQGLVVDVPQWDGSAGGNPTGQIFNSTQDFLLGNGKPAVFIVSTEDGTIQGWNGGTSTEIKVNNWPNAVYKGLVMGSADGANYIYAANFHDGTVDVFDGSFQPHSFGGSAFVDPNLPSGYAPFNVANVNGNIIVSYALQDADKHDDVRGLGHGYLDVYSSKGELMQRLPHVFQLNSPWAMVVAPASGWGNFSGKLLVGQFGSGAIIAYDLSNGTFFGTMQDDAGLPIRINGLWGLGFGNGAKAGPTDTLYFSSGYFDEAHGLFGTITVANNVLSQIQHNNHQTQHKGK